MAQDSKLRDSHAKLSQRLGLVSLTSGSSDFTVVAAPEPGARRRDESVWRWLERSSEPVAAAARAQWDGWLLRMPPGPRARSYPQVPGPPRRAGPRGSG
jgi:hypothetical protein